jgi:hypothetical protein
MDYKKNYFKYKNKYLNLKEKFGGDPKLELNEEDLKIFTEEDMVNLPDNFLELLKKEYSTIKFDKITQPTSYPNNDITYGEMHYDDMKNILEHLHTTHKISFKNFIDLGSGRGKLPLQVASLPHVEKSIGIELVKERHDDAEDLKNKLNDYENIIKKVEFINDDFNNIELDKIVDDVTLVWICNDNFSPELNNQLLSKLLKLPKNSIISCSNQILEFDRIKKISKLKIQMSWYKNKNIHFYIIE